jgi:hypothetical protein
VIVTAIRSTPTTTRRTADTDRPNGYYGRISTRIRNGQKIQYFKGTPEERFWQRVDRGAGIDGCWGWRGYCDRKGYGRIGVEGQRVALAHRLSWELHFGPIPDGLHVLHHCDNPPCTNPRHLWLGTNADNQADMRAKARDSDKGLFSTERFAREGHPYAKLTRNDAEEIRAAFVPRRVTRKDLALRFGVSESAIKRVLSRQTWT